jgi:hypothetical protein
MIHSLHEKFKHACGQINPQDFVKKQKRAHGHSKTPQ